MPWHIRGVRLSRPRVLLRVALLVAGGVFMLWHAAQAWRASGELEGSAATLQSRVALIAALIGALALLTAIGAAFSLRPRKRGGSLRLGSAPAPPRETPGRGRSAPDR
jgi:hypothetical protein